MNNIEIGIAILGGLGLGILLGSEFSGSVFTLLGAILLVFVLVVLIIFSKKDTN